MFSLFNKKKLATEKDFSVAGKVSIWVGDFDDEGALLNYIEAEDGMGQDFGCVLLEQRELSIEPQPKPIHELLSRFSSSAKFTEQMASGVGETYRARCAVVCYASDYTLLGFRPKLRARLRFIGVASF